MRRLWSLPVLHSFYKPVHLSFAILSVLAFLPACPAHSQAITIQTGPPIDRRYTQITPTTVSLPSQQIDARGHQDILRTLFAEQGFAMRPLPRGKKGLTLAANGKLSPAGEGYLSAITEYGLSVKPGDRVVLSNVKIEKDHIVFDINGGPEHKHEFLRHVQIGMGGPNMSAPVVQTADDGEPAGARITLSFSKYVPGVTPAQVKALLAPLISFDMKTPVQAYTDTLPPKLKDAILNHHVMVGMSTDMVLFAMGPPETKSREVDGQTPFEEWIYGHPPQDVQFVRVNGNRVIRVELAKLGQPLEIFTKDEVEGLMTTDGKPVLAEVRVTNSVQMGDVHREADTQAPAAPPTLRAPGEKLPSDGDSNSPGTLNREGPMKPVIFPKDTTNDPAHTVNAHPVATQDAAKPAPATTTPSTANTTPADPAAPASAEDPAKSDPKPDGTPKPADKPAPPPSSNFYSDRPQPAAF
jgi:hypothetical protein